MSGPPMPRHRAPRPSPATCSRDYGVVPAAPAWPAPGSQRHRLQQRPVGSSARRTARRPHRPILDGRWSPICRAAWSDCSRSHAGSEYSMSCSRRSTWRAPRSVAARSIGGRPSIGCVSVSQVLASSSSPSACRASAVTRARRSARSLAAGESRNPRFREAGDVTSDATWPRALPVLWAALAANSRTTSRGSPRATAAANSVMSRTRPPSIRSPPSASATFATATGYILAPRSDEPSYMAHLAVAASSCGSWKSGSKGERIAW